MGIKAGESPTRGAESIVPRWMELALEEARKAELEGEVPIGAVGVWKGELLARDHNRSIGLHDPTAHAEILIVRQVARRLANYRLDGLEIYVTVEPCPMCAGALTWARVKRLVFGTRDPKAGAVVSKAQLLSPELFNHKIQVIEGIMAEACRQILLRFFEQRRRRKCSGG